MSSCYYSMLCVFWSIMKAVLREARGKSLWSWKIIYYVPNQIPKAHLLLDLIIKPLLNIS